MEENFTLQLLHAGDQEAGIEAVENAPNFSAVLNALEDDYDNTVILSSGDAYIPGPFFSASETAFGGQGRGDILIQNELGFQAIAFGNHEFDLGTGLVADLIASDEEDSYPGTDFPYLSANLDFSTDEDLAPLVVADGQETDAIPNSISGNTIITVDSESIGVVGATTPTLPTIASPGDVTVNPIEFNSSDPEDIAALAQEVQTSVDSLLADNPDLDKVILLAHFQQISIEQQVAELLTDVDIVVAGGSNTLLADETDRLRAGDEADGIYPILSTAADGNPIAIVNTEGNYQYVGRLVVDFDENGIIIPDSIDPNISGAYTTDTEGVAAVNGTPDAEIVAITEQLGTVIAEQEGNIFGSTDVFLNGIREDVRTQETNLGNLTADANLAFARTIEPEVVISIKNGGGIRDSIGAVIVPPGATDPDDFERVPPQANELAGKEEGEISQLDISNSLRFNNGLTLLTLTAEELLEVIEYGVAETEEGATPGRFPQVAGLSFSFDADLLTGDRILSLAVEDGDGNIIDTIVEDGELVGDSDRTFRVVTLNFLADGGDGYPFPETKRVDLAQSEEAQRMGEATFVPDGTEQDALAEFLVDNFSEMFFDSVDTPPEEDERIQNLDFRQDTVLEEEAIGIEGTSGSESITGGAGDDLISGLGGSDTLFGGDGFDTISGGPGSDIIEGGLAPDVLIGGLGGDLLRGRNGADLLFGGKDRDTIEGGVGDDLLRGSQGRDVLRGGDGADTLTGGSARDILEGNDGDDDLFGGQGRDILEGGNGIDYLFGGQGQDILSGRDDSDLLIGGIGGDILQGGSGDDVLIGGQGRDIIIGGDGADVFVYGSADLGGVDIIRDFEVGVDAIDIADIFARSIYGSSTPFDDYVTLSQRGSDTVVRIDSDGDRVGGAIRGLAILSGIDSEELSSADFIV